MKHLAILVVFFFGGCAAVASVSPSRFCEQVRYQRDGAVSHLALGNCRLSAGDDANFLK